MPPLSIAELSSHTLILECFTNIKINSKVTEEKAKSFYEIFRWKDDSRNAKASNPTYASLMLCFSRSSHSVFLYFEILG